MSKAEDLFAAMWSEHVTGWEPERQWRFHPARRWRFDFAWPGVKLAVEIDGFGFGHQKIGAIKSNAEKQNAAVRLGWRVLRYTTGGKSAMRHAVDEVAEFLHELAERAGNGA